MAVLASALEPLFFGWTWPARPRGMGSYWPQMAVIVPHVGATDVPGDGQEDDPDRTSDQFAVGESEVPPASALRDTESRDWGSEPYDRVQGDQACADDAESLCRPAYDLHRC